MNNNLLRAARAYINEHRGPVFFPPGAAGVMQLHRAIESGNINRIRRIRSAMISSGNFNPSDWNGLVGDGPAYRAITGLPLEGDNAATRARLERERNNLSAQLRRRAARQRRNSNNHFLNPNYLRQIRQRNAAFFSRRNNSNGERTPPARARRNSSRSPQGAPRRGRPHTGIPLYNAFNINTRMRPYMLPNNTGLAKFNWNSQGILIPMPNKLRNNKNTFTLNRFKSGVPYVQVKTPSGNFYYSKAGFKKWYESKKIDPLTKAKLNNKNLKIVRFEVPKNIQNRAQTMRRQRAARTISRAWRQKKV